MIEVNLFIINFDLLSPFTYIHPGFYVCVYILSFIFILFISIILNFRKINILEEYLLDLLIPSLIFTLILIFSLIPLFYNITVSIAILLLLLSVFFHRQKDNRYIWFIRPCALLFLFDLISITSYFVIFSLPLYFEYNLILSATFTSSIIGFCFALFYHDLRGKLKRRSISVILILSVATSFTFSYLFLKISLSFTFSDILPWIIAGNIAIILSYIAIGIYQWKISWAIWKAGYWIWIFTPIINYLIIAEAFTGINIQTNALNFFGIPIYGSHLIAFVICLLVSLPFWYTWIKTHFNYVLFIVWGLSLFLIYWFSQNAFFGYTFLINLSFVGISIILLMPILYRLRVWKILSILWLGFTIILTVFISYILIETNLGVDMIVSMNLIIIGFLFIIFSFFPNIRALKNIVLIIAYSIAIIGIFLTILNLIFSITYNLPVSINLSFIIVAFSLFTSRILKLNRNLFNFLISTILTINFSLLTFFTFSIIPNFEFFALFFAISICGGSLLIFNRFRMISPIKMIIPLMILSIGVALTLSSLIYIFIPNSFFIVSATFIAIILLFNYPVLKHIRHILLCLVPVPFCLVILHFFSLIVLFQPLLNLILIGLILYTSIFQIFTYLNYGTVKIVNLLSFILNSTYISLLITIISPFTIIYQILEFCIIWSILIIFCINYLEKAGQDLVREKTISIFLKISSLITILLYFEIALLIFKGLNEFLLLEIAISILIFFGTIFLLSFLDLKLFKRVNNKIIYPVNLISYIYISFSSFIFFNQFLAINIQIIFLNLIILFILQFYSIYIIFSFLNQFENYDKDKLNIYRKIIQTVLLNIVFLIISLFGSSYFTTLIIDTKPILSGLPSVFLFLMIFTFILFILNNIVRIKFTQYILFGYYIIFIITFASFWVFFIILFNLINVFSVSLLLFTITILVSYLVYSVSKIYKEKVDFTQINKIYSLIIFFLYLEISIILFGLSYFYFNIFASILISQLTLFLISIMERYIIRKIKTSLVFIIHTISYFNISWSLFVIIFQFTQNIFDLNLIFFILMQFYTNISYFITRSKLNVTKEPVFKKWKLIRQKIIGSCFYLTLLIYILNYLLFVISELQLIILILGGIIHGLMYIDRFIFKFLADLSKYVIIFSLFLIIGTSILYSLGWVFIFSFQIIPLIILLVLVEITYLIKLLEFWDIKKVNFSIIRNPLIIVYYINFLIWPFFHLVVEIFNIITIMLVFSIILILISLIDIRINAINQKLRITILKTGYIMFISLLSLEIFLFLEFIIQPNLLFNSSVSGLFFLITIGFIIKPFKRHRAISFFYWLSIFTLISLIIYFAYLSGWSFTVLLISVALYPFIFMLEELKELFAHLLEYIHKLILKIKAIITILYRKFINFLKNNFRIIQIILCIFIGIITGITFSDMVLNILNPYHATLLSLAT
ncbi:MAG: O-antigen polymerase, partial [Candidatus Hermodarchaeota archaeon]